MSTTTDTTTDTTTTDPTDPATNPLETEADGTRPEREAAKYRRQLRETEAERDALAARVEALQRAEVERVAGETISQPAALWAAGTDLAALVNADGTVDPLKVTNAATTAADALGLARPLRDVIPSQGDTPDRPATAPGGFSTAFGPQPVD